MREKRERERGGGGVKGAGGVVEEKETERERETRRKKGETGRKRQTKRWGENFTSFEYNKSNFCVALEIFLPISPMYSRELPARKHHIISAFII